MIIYKVENKINGKVYIGQTKHDLGARIAYHIRQNRFHFQKALNKYGLQSFIISVIDEADSKLVLNEKEKYWIVFYSCMAPSGYNLTAGGGGMSDPPEVTRQKLRKRKAFLGKHHSEETKQKIREKLKGKPCTEERKQKLRGRHPSEETIAKMRKIRSEEFKEKHRKPYKEGRVSHFKGKPPWNKGLTKETDERVLRSAEKLRRKQLV